MSVCSKDTKKKKKEKIVKQEPKKKVKNPDTKELTEEQVEALQNR